MRSMAIMRSTVLGVVLLMSLVFGLVLAGCGEKVAEEAIENELEQALGSDNANVDVDIDGDDSGSITISGDDGDSSVSFGGAASVPDGFPAGLVPGDADIVSSMSVDESDGSLSSVVFNSGKDLDEMYEWFLGALPDAGYDVVNKMQFDSDGNKGFSITGEGSADGCNVTGAVQDGEFMYSVMIVAN